jgi:P4 family phage/plasmid primase-like protien
MDDFKRFITRYKSEKGQGFTHTSIGQPRTSLFVPDAKLDAFYEVYKRAMMDNVPLHFTEKPTNPSCFRTDLDFKFALPTGDAPRQRMYLAEDVKRITAAYFSLLSSFLDAPDDHFVAYVMEKPAPLECRGQLKDGLHIVWPHLVCHSTLMHLVRKRILDSGTEVFAGIPVVNTFDVIVDSAIIDRNNWQMYGSRKPDNTAYRVTRILRYDRETATIVDITPPHIAAEDELRFVNLFSMRNKREPTPVFIDKAQEIDEYVRHVLPTMDDRRKNKLHLQIFSKSVNHRRNYTSDEELNLARQLVADCLSPHRAENYEDWIKLGWTLRNIDYRLADAWVQFSKFSSKYISGECEKLWNAMRMDTLGIGTLRWWAKQDNETRYNEVLESSVITLIDKCSNEHAHFDVAKVVHALLKDDYRFTGMDMWYTFAKNKHRWVRTREGLKLQLDLSTRVCSEFMKRSSHHTNAATMLMDDAKDNAQKRAAQLFNIATQLKKNSYKRSIMAEIKGLFSDDEFEDLLDSHPHLIGFENGVYDLRMHEFRDGSPDDYISFTTGRHYIPFDADSIEAKEIHAYMAQVFTNENVRKYFKDLLLLLVDGGIRQEKFYVFTGSGSNSKSAILNLVQKAMGEYYCILPIALLTQKRAASNAAQSELARTKGRRVAVMQEPGADEKINIGLMKELSGGDRIMARGLYKEPTEFRPQFKMIMTCNELPEVPGDDGGTWRRIRVIEFTSKFCDAPSPDNPREFPIDITLLDKFDRWSDTFIAMLIDHHKRTEPTTIVEPMEVRIATESYKANNDVIGQFIGERIERVDDTKTCVQFLKAFQEFKAWAYTAVGKGKKIPDRSQFKAYLEKTFGPYPKAGNGWRGMRFTTGADGNEEDSDDE